MKIAIFSMNVAGIYSGGRYLSLIMAYALSRAGADVDYYTNLIPAFQDDFKGMNETCPVRMVAEERWPDGGDPQVDWVIVIPSGGIADEFYLKAKRFAQQSNAMIALLSFETANWFNELVHSPKSPLPWESWAGVISEGGLVLTIAKEGVDYAKSFYSNLVPDASVDYDFWHPAINDDIATAIDWQNIPVYPNRIISFVRTSDQHKGANELLSFPGAFFRNKTICLVFGRGIDHDFLRALKSKTSDVFGSTILAYDRVTDEEKLALVASSSALLFPSYFEGFGYPPVEAAFVGTPTVAFDLPVLRETLGDKATFVPPGDIQSLAEALHKVATSQPKRRTQIPIPAQCATRQSGQDLIDKLTRATMRLGAASKRKSWPAHSKWVDHQDFWGWCEATYAGAGALQISGVASALNKNRHFEVLVNGMIVQHATGVSDSDSDSDHAGDMAASVSFDCEIPMGISSTNAGQVELSVRSEGFEQVIQTTKARLDSVSRLTNQFWSSDSDRVGRLEVALLISDVTFGKSTAARLGLASLAVQLRVSDVRTVLVAPNSVIERLAGDDVLTGLFSEVLESGPSVDRSNPDCEIVVSESQTTSDSLVDLQANKSGGKVSQARLTFNSHAAMVSEENAQYVGILNHLSVNGARTSDIYLMNCFAGSQLSTEAYQVIHALNAQSWPDRGLTIHCIAPDNFRIPSGQDQVSVPRNTDIISVSHLITEMATVDLAILDCEASLVSTTTSDIGTILRSANILALSDFRNASLAATSILANAKAEPCSDEKQFLLLDRVIKELELPVLDRSSFIDRLMSLRRSRSVANSFVITSTNAAPDASRPALATKFDVFTSTSNSNPLSSIIRGSEYYVADSAVGFKAEKPAVFEFRCPTNTRSINVDFLIEFESKTRDTASLIVAFNGLKCVADSIPAGKYKRVTCTIELPTHEPRHNQHRLEIVVTEAAPCETFRIRAMALVPQSDRESMSEKYGLDYGSEQSLLPSAVAPVDQTVEPFALQMNAPKSVFAVGRGWGRAEKNYRWTLGKCAEVHVPYVRGFSGSAKLSIAAGAYMADSQSTATMHIQINGQRIGSMSFSSAPTEEHVVVPSAVLAQGVDRIDLVIESPWSPSDLGRSADNRKLGFCVYKFNLTDFQADTAEPGNEPQAEPAQSGIA